MSCNSGSSACSGCRLYFFHKHRFSRFLFRFLDEHCPRAKLRLLVDEELGEALDEVLGGTRLEQRTAVWGGSSPGGDMWARSSSLRSDFRPELGKTARSGRALGRRSVGELL